MDARFIFAHDAYQGHSVFELFTKNTVWVEVGCEPPRLTMKARLASNCRFPPEASVSEENRLTAHALGYEHADLIGW